MIIIIMIKQNIAYIRRISFPPIMVAEILPMGPRACPSLARSSDFLSVVDGKKSKKDTFLENREITVSSVDTEHLVSSSTTVSCKFILITFLSYLHFDFLFLLTNIGIREGFTKDLQASLLLWRIRI